MVRGRGGAAEDRKLIQISGAITNPEFGKAPEQRSIREHIRYAVIDLDKPSGPTSHEVVAWVKNILGVEKAGHGGTLDPRVTGVLPVALEESTKIVQALLPAPKEYVCTMRLHGSASDARLREVINEFVGRIIQRPPVKSAVKRQLRQREIYAIDLLERENEHLLFKVRCEAGTYIRKLCHDIGEVLGCGAHMVELRRTKSGAFGEEDIVTLHDLMDAYKFWKEGGDEKPLRKVLLPVERSLDDTPKIVVRDSAVDALCHGADLAVPGICKLDSDIKKGNVVGIFTLKGELVALAKAMMSCPEILSADSGITSKTDRVLMKPGTYPKMWKAHG